jgi:hypothetical protein
MSEARYYAVDRIEGDLVVLIGDSGEEVLASLEELPTPLEEGTVLRVRVDVEGGHAGRRRRAVGRRWYEAIQISNSQQPLVN